MVCYSMQKSVCVSYANIQYNTSQNLHVHVIFILKSAYRKVAENLQPAPLHSSPFFSFPLFPHVPICLPPALVQLIESHIEIWMVFGSTPRGVLLVLLMYHNVL